MNARFRTDRRVCPEPSLCWGAAKSALKRSFLRVLPLPSTTNDHQPPTSTTNVHRQRFFPLPRTLLLTHALFEPRRRARGRRSFRSFRSLQAFALLSNSSKSSKRSKRPWVRTRCGVKPAERQPTASEARALSRSLPFRRATERRRRFPLRLTASFELKRGCAFRRIRVDRRAHADAWGNPPPTTTSAERDRWIRPGRRMIVPESRLFG